MVAAGLARNVVASRAGAVIAYAHVVAPPRVRQGNALGEGRVALRLEAEGQDHDGAVPFPIKRARGGVLARCVHKKKRAKNTHEGEGYLHGSILI